MSANSSGWGGGGAKRRRRNFVGVFTQFCQSPPQFFSVFTQFCLLPPKNWISVGDRITKIFPCMPKPLSMQFVFDVLPKAKDKCMYDLD